MPSTLDTLPLLDLPTPAAWRAWLEANGASSAGVWLLLTKKNSRLPGIRLAEAQEEALCFGWVDSKEKSLGADHVKLVFTPRKPNSTWAKTNKEAAARLIAEGRMAPAGLAAIEVAKANGAWHTLDEIDDLTVPDDLAAALAESEAAGRNFAAFPPGARRTYLWWIKTAKRPETRAKRIAETVRLVGQNIKNPQPMR